MKRLKLLFFYALIIPTLTTLVATKLFATAGQWSSTGSTIYYNDGNLGIGTSSPSEPLTINNSSNIGTALIGDGVGSIWIQGNTYSGDGYGNIGYNAYLNSGWKRKTVNKESWVMGFLSNSGGTGSVGNGIFRISHAAAQSTTAISNLEPMFEVSANGTTFAKAFVVEATNYWPDYVFNNDYKLMPLNELSDYINQNKHLPYVPSQEDITKNGQDLGEVQKIQMQKIEELTLYTIQQDKKINDLELRLEKLETTLNNK
ncbi:MAG: hypothetical protein ABIM99_01260 [Candidatus Dojkabacteria bacterium]